MDEYEWDKIDWDEKIDDITKSQKKQQEEETSDKHQRENFFAEDDGNYFDINQKKLKTTANEQNNKAKGSRNVGVRSEAFVQPYSHKDLIRIREYSSESSKLHNLIYETFGQFERFLMTHQMDLTHEIIVELLIIDVVLMEIPFNSHNRLLLEELSRIKSFWNQLVGFIKTFLECKHKDLKFLLTVDVNGFFNNIETMLCNLLVNNLFNSDMAFIFDEIIKALELLPNEWSHPERLRAIQDALGQNLNVFKIYDIYPTISDLTASSECFHENSIKGEYQSVSQYLQIQLPLLKEDFISKFRDGVQQLKTLLAVDKLMKTPNLTITPNVKIYASPKTMWNMDCRVTVVKLTNQSCLGNRRIFNGQMLCFTSSQDLTDLIVAIVINCDPVNQAPDEIVIEIIRKENIINIFDRSLIMLESTTFFEPYHRVFNVLKNLNKHNFPFKDQILKLQKSPLIQHSERYTYKNFTFKVENFLDWPTHQQLELEGMQLKAIQAAVTSELTIIQGPPGTGKTFVGLEILNILLENTNETILVLTETNNALDKFLLGALKVTDSIARMGGQCKCDELKPFVAKATTPFESKKYMKKLQAQHREEVAKLMTADEDHDAVYQKIFQHHRLIEEIHQLNLFCSINQKRVIGMTTTFAARSSAINKMLQPGIVIIEEASEVLESHVIVSLTKKTKQLIMIGDHQQLKPLTNSYELAKKFNFNVSLFERLIRNDFNFITLDVQMRMKAEICDLVRGTIYKSLRDGACVARYPTVKGMSTNFFCLNHQQSESIGSGETSKENLFEAECIVKLCDHLIRSGNDSHQITILTVYAAQAQRIRKRLVDFPFDVRVAVLDAYQGEESDIILLSLVRSNNRRDIGFLASENRIAVVLSRAKFGFYIVANMKCLASASPIWKQVFNTLREKRVVGDKIPDLEIY